MDGDGDWIYDEEGSWNKEEVEVCGLDGCPFKGPKSVLEDHIMYLHATGVYNRLARENDPEEIAAWKEQRKKKYPTLSLTESARMKNESRKAQQEIVNKARTEAYEQFMSERKTTLDKPMTCKNRQKNQKRHIKKRQIKQAKKDKENFLDDEEDPPGWNGPLASFPGTLVFKELSETESEDEGEKHGISDIFHISDDEEEMHLQSSKTPANISHEGNINRKREQLKEERVSHNAFITNSDDDDDGPPLEMTIVKKTCEEAHAMMSNKVMQSNSLEKGDKEKCFNKESQKEVMGSCKRKSSHLRGNVCSEKDSEQDQKLSSNSNKNELNVDGKDSSVSNAKKPKMNAEMAKSPYIIEPPTKPKIKFMRKTKQNTTLLEKLLSNEVREEKKVLLQCIKYVCDNNFFLES